MGILQSTARFLTSKPNHDEEEEVETPIHPDLQNHYISSSERFSKLLSFPISIYKALKFLIRRVGFAFAKLGKAGDPLLPVQNLASSTSTEPLLAQTSPISSPITAFSDEDQSECDYHCVDDDIDRILLWCENVGEQNCSNALVSSDFDQEIVEEIAPANFPSSSSFRVEENYSAARNEIDHDAVVSVPQMRCSYASIVVRNLEIVQEFNIVPATEKEEERGEGKVERESGVGELRKIKHYSNRHRILLVGEGDFSFSACLAVAFGSATNIIATSLNNTAFLKKNYGSALSNIEEVTSRGGKVMHGIDATEIAKHEFLRQLKFDRIVFNFPFAGFFPKSSPEFQLRQHRRLVSRFLKNAKEMMSENGEIHISNKTNGVNAEFNVESIASSHGLRLIAAVKFKCSNYPGYNTKYGFGGDKNFNCYPSKTFKFGLKT